MALRFCDGFDHYATADLLKKWNDRGNNEALGGGRFGNGLQILNTNWYVGKYLTPHATWIIGFAVYFSPVVGTGNTWFRIQDDGTVQVSVYMDSNGRLTFTRNGTYLGVASTVFRSYSWYYVEIKVTIDNSNGAIAMRVNGVGDTITFSTGTATTQDTQYTANATANRVYFVGTSVGSTIVIDDLYICDGSGAANNDFLGDIRVQTILPSADGGTNEWTASANSRYQCVDDPTPDSVTDYISEDTAGQKNTFAFGNVTPTSGTVKGVATYIAARKDDAGSRSIAPVYGNGTPASDVDGATVSVGDSYIYYSEIKEQDPVAAADWTIASVNAAEFGVKLVS